MEEWGSPAMLVLVRLPTHGAGDMNIPLQSCIALPLAVAEKLMSVSNL